LTIPGIGSHSSALVARAFCSSTYAGFVPVSHVGSSPLDQASPSAIILRMSMAIEFPTDWAE
jgi:hypothetical protein